MPKTYNTIPSVATGDLLTATAWNNQATTVNNLRVPPLVLSTGINPSQSIANNTETALQWTVAPTVDTDSFWSSGANTKFTCTTAGVYQWNASYQINSNAVTQLYIVVTWGSSGLSVGNAAPVSQNGVARIALSGMASVASGDFFQVAIQQVSGAARTAYAAHFSAAWLGQVS